MKNIANYLLIIALTLSGFLLTSWSSHNSNITGNIADATVTVVITSKSETRITGTFSGELVNVATQKPSLLTDGKFDLSLRKQKQ